MLSSCHHVVSTGHRKCNADVHFQLNMGLYGLQIIEFRFYLFITQRPNFLETELYLSEL